MRTDLAFGPSLRFGVLGGGQLGRMMIQSAIDWDLRVEVMDPDPDAPCRYLTHRFVQGSLDDADAVEAFGRGLDVLTIEIEHVSVPGLRRLAAAGVAVRPSPDTIALIQDKGTQKQFLTAHGFPTADFTLIDSSADAGSRGYPVVAKLRRGGYDGKGVRVLRDASAAPFDAPCVLEDLVDIALELSVIVARNPSGEVATFPVVEAVFDPVANLVDHLVAPARIAEEIAAQARGLAVRVAEALDLEGLLAVELFLDRSGKLWVNELAPRTHNSGHHTIEANRTSQFEQHLRAVLDLPLGDPSALQPAAMLNLVGGPDAHGRPTYPGLGAALARPGVHVHLYGKSEVRPYRKLGHITVLGDDAEAVVKGALRQKTE